MPLYFTVVCRFIIVYVRIKSRLSRSQRLTPLRRRRGSEGRWAGTARTSTTSSRTRASRRTPCLRDLGTRPNGFASGDMPAECGVADQFNCNPRSDIAARQYVRYIYIYIYIYMCVCARMCACMQSCMHACARIHIHVYVYIYIYIRWPSAQPATAPD